MADDIKLRVDVDVSDANATISKFNSTVSSAFTSSDKKVQNLGRSLDRVTSNMERVRSQMQTMENTKVPTAEYTNLQNRIEMLTKSYMQAKKEQDKLGQARLQTPEYASASREVDKYTQKVLKARADMGKIANVSGTDNAAYKIAQNKVNEYTEALAGAINKQIELQNAGKQYEPSRAFDEKTKQVQLYETELQKAQLKEQELLTGGGAFMSQAQADPTKFASLQNTFNNLGNQANFFSREIDNANQSIDNTNTAVDTVKASTSKLSLVFTMLANKGIGAVKSIASAFLTKLKPSIEKTADSHNVSVKKMLTMLLKWAFGIRSIFLLYKKVRTEIKNGMKSLANDFPEIQAQLDALSSSWWAFKSSITSAFQPIFSYVVPALITLINYLTSAMNALANFFALLTGQGYYYKAVKGNNKVAKAVGGTGKAAKEAALDIAEYDKLLVIHKDDNGGGGGGGGGGGDSDAYNWEKVNTHANSLVEKLKNMWGVFKEAWNDKGADVMKAFKYALKSCKDLIVDIGETFYEVFMDGYGYNWIISVLGILEQMLLLVGDLAVSFKQAWDENDRGRKLFEAIFTTVTKINNLIITLISSFRKAWNEAGLGKAIIGNILEIITHIVTTIGNLANQFRIAWEKNEVGKRIFADILGIINIVLTTINDITGAIEEWSSKIDFYPELESIEGMLDSTKQVTQDICDIAKELYDDYIEPMCTKLIEEWLPKITNMVTEFLDETDPTLQDIKKMLEEIAPIMKLIANPLFTAWLTDMSLKLTGLNGAIRFITQAITVAAKQFNLFIAAFKSTLAYLNVQGNLMGNAIKNIFKSAWEYIKNQPLMKLGKYIWDGIKNGFKENGVIGVIQELWKWFKSGFAQIFGIHSPATKMEPFGKNILLGIINGFIKAFGKIQTAVTKFKNKLGSLLTKGLDIAVNFITNLKGVVTSITGLDNLKTKFNNMYNAFRSRTATMTTNMAGVAKKIDDLVDVKGKFDALRDNWSGAKATFESLIGGDISNINELSTNKNSWLSKLTNLKNGWKGATAQFNVKSSFNGKNDSIDNLNKGDDSWLGRFSTLYNTWSNNGKNNKTASASFNASFKNGNTNGNLSTSDISGYASAMRDVQGQWHDNTATLTLYVSRDEANINGFINDIKSRVTKAFLDAWASGHRAEGGIITPRGITGFANGGVISNGMSRLWNSIPKFAGGGSAHGTMFIAGEAGPEIVGHVGNRTEVLNKSQLASVMLHAVKEGMQSALASISGLSVAFDINSLTQIPIPVIVQGQVLPVNEAFMTKFDDNNKTLTNIENMLQSLMSRQDSPQAHQPIQVTIDGKVVAEVVWNEQEKKYKQSGRYNARYV